MCVAPANSTAHSVWERLRWSSRQTAGDEVRRSWCRQGETSCTVYLLIHWL